MTDEATWTEKFDRWWAEIGAEGPFSYSATFTAEQIRDFASSVFMAGAAAERAEHPDAQLERQLEQIRESERAAERRHHLR